ncbi:MAG: hypothetical protein IJ679_08270 [Lachnospiraceae bacterium]|nr:hypothetical protein [Lachnospiraceae bacterium]
MMIYSSFRIGDLCVADIDIENGMLNGGEKTIASRKRRAPPSTRPPLNLGRNSTKPPSTRTNGAAAGSTG